MISLRDIIATGVITYNGHDKLDSTCVKRTRPINFMVVAEPVKKIPNIDKTVLICLKDVGGVTLLVQRPIDAEDHLLVKVAICVLKRSYNDVFVDACFLINKVIKIRVRALSDKEYCFVRPEKYKKRLSAFVSREMKSHSGQTDP